MKKLIVGILLLVAVASQAAVLSTNVTVGGVHLLSTARASVYSIEVISDKNVTVDFYDCDTKADPYYGTNSVSAAYVSRTSYATNIASSYIASNGYTNWYTNSGIFTYSVTNTAATNALPKMATIVAAANTYNVHNVDAIFTRGIAILTTTNANIVVNYRPGN